MIKHFDLRKFKNISFILLISPIILSITALAPIYAQTTSTPSPTTTGKLSTVQDQRMQNLKDRADSEINRRLVSLVSLTLKVNSNGRISDADKIKFIKDIQAEIDNLKVLNTKIDNDTNAETLRADVKSIVDSYRVYLLYLPKINILLTTNALSNLVQKLNTEVTKLQVRLNEAKSEGKEVTDLQKKYDDMVAKLTEIQNIFKSAEDTITGLEPSGYPGNKSSLSSGRDYVKKAVQVLKVVRDDMKIIVDGLKTLYPKTISTT